MLRKRLINSVGVINNFEDAEANPLDNVVSCMKAKGSDAYPLINYLAQSGIAIDYISAYPPLSVWFVFSGQVSPEKGKFQKTVTSA